MQKGISPLIATVLLVGLSVTTVVLITSFSKTQLETATEGSEEVTENFITNLNPINLKLETAVLSEYQQARGQGDITNLPTPEPDTKLEIEISNPSSHNLELTLFANDLNGNQITCEPLTFTLRPYQLDLSVQFICPNNVDINTFQIIPLSNPNERIGFKPEDKRT